ncbi:zinc ABC transporter substrate-binding protein ZnuA [Enterovibrio sp. 27052020O]|uniref:zinc ABC transporter substrate-binding protein ZnuA n=1 Tax=Enterovibrio sp. 27052020O TaxID=3241166 RepID=UPI003890E1E0
MTIARYFPIFMMLLLTSSMAANASTLNIVTTIKPLGLIAHDIAGDLANVDVLLPDSASPHDYALKPSDIKKLRNADAVVWVGPELELFLEKVLNGQPNTLRLTTYDGMPVRYYDEGGHEDHDGHDHNHEGVDGHLWLGPEQSKVIARAIKLALSQRDPVHAADYQANYEKFVTDVTQAQTDIAKNLDVSQSKGYFLFHDAYGYFESAFGLKPTGHLTINPDRKPGARTLVSIRSALMDNQAQCVFTEPQFNPGLVNSVVKGTSAKVVTLDPMAQDMSLSNNHYVDFLNALGKSYADCFSE